MKTGRVIIPGSGRNPINLIAAADVARYVIIGLTDPRARDRVLEVGGWDNTTKDEIAGPLGADFHIGTPAEHDKFNREEIAKWSKVVADSGARID